MRTSSMQSKMRSAERINFAVVAVTATLFLAIAAFVAFSTSKMMENEARNTVENVVKATVLPTMNGLFCTSSPVILNI